MLKHKASDNQRTLAQKHEKVLWIVAGSLFILPSLFGEPNGAFIGIGMMFMIFGLAAKKKSPPSADDE
jgi:flagellar biosynthesis component FlhA